jgi:hypothetical protein
MKAHILKGSKQEIAASLVRISGEVREAIVFEEESTPEMSETATGDTEDVFAEMGPFMVDAQEVDDSRGGIYTRMEGE